MVYHLVARSIDFTYLKQRCPWFHILDINILSSGARY
jgi:hypothetical protein